MRSNNSPLCPLGCDDPACCEHVCLLGHDHSGGFLLDCSPPLPEARLIERPDGSVEFEDPPPAP